jgi:hypothetical protein
MCSSSALLSVSAPSFWLLRNREAFRAAHKGGQEQTDRTLHSKQKCKLGTKKAKESKILSNFELFTGKEKSYF